MPNLPSGLHIKGRVFDADTGLPVSDAVVKADNGTQRSDGQGKFDPSLQKKPSALFVSKERPTAGP